MNVLMLSQFYPPIVGGQERHVRTLAVGLVERGHRVDVLTIAPIGEEPGVQHDDGVRVLRVRTSAQQLPFLYGDPSRPHATPVSDRRLSRAVGVLLARNRYDVLHAHDWAIASALGPARSAGTPVVYTQHDYSHICATKRLMRGDVVCPAPGPRVCMQCASRQYGAVGPAVVVANAWARRRRGSGVAAFVPVSTAVAHSTRLRPGTFEVIPNFIPDELVVDHLQPTPGGPIVFVGDLSHDKGASVLVDAYRAMSAPPPLVLAGRQFAGVDFDLPPGSSLAGVLPYGDVIELIRSASVVAVPSIVADCSPTVVLEAMAAGRVVVASATGGIVDQVVDGETGFLVEPGDPGGLRRAIEVVLEDGARAAAMGRAALERVRAFTSSSVVRRIEDLYARVAVGAVGRSG